MILLLIILISVFNFNVQGGCPQRFSQTSTTLKPKNDIRNLLDHPQKATKCENGYPDHCIGTCGCLHPIIDRKEMMALQPRVVWNGKGGSLKNPTLTWDKCKPKVHCEQGREISIIYDTWNKTVLSFHPMFIHTNESFWCTNGVLDLANHPYRMVFWSCEV